MQDHICTKWTTLTPEGMQISLTNPMRLTKLWEYWDVVKANNLFMKFASITKMIFRHNIYIEMKP